ncbi:hypothetical protein AAL_00431 [Moelleriella libera RCEF 2490]|uniref:Uncharacterized protein n=1 Tax=Moelleriella libera RCEF 2490 TaxID=1081109 RepID=A0A162K488_9HYPO|nr:hypothetical protein AAL_00431 [Moelleriella libera RCEF 2490]
MSNGLQDPLNSHPTFQPPPRLHERPLISPDEPRQYFAHATFYDESSTDDDYADERQSMEDDYTVCSAQALHFSQPKEELIMPPHSSSMDHQEERTEPQDYFMIQFVKRPQLPRSRWSDSTIQTSDQMTPNELSSRTFDDDSSDEEEDAPLEIPNFSHKRTTAPRRPPMRSLDSLEDFIKKGGWKRRGIVFNGSEAKQQVVS